MKCTCDKEVCDVSELCPECASEYQVWLDEQNELFSQFEDFLKETENENEKVG